MAKVSLNKITPIKSLTDVQVQINNETVLVKQYLTVSELTNFLMDLMNYTFDVDGFISPLRYEVYNKVLLLKYFTNISITETMIVNVEKTYDTLYINNVFEPILAAIPEKYLQLVNNLTEMTSKKIQEYNTSLIGWMKQAANDKAATELDLENVINELKNSENFDVVKSVMENLE